MANTERDRDAALRVVPEPSSDPTPFPEIKPEAAWDPFDPECLKAQARGDVTLEKVLLNVRVRKPKKTEFFRVDPRPEMQTEMRMFMTEERECFVVSPSIQDALGTQLVLVRLHVCVNRTGDVFLWPVRIPSDHEKDNSYWETARDAARHAVDDWIRMEANQSEKNYAVVKARGDLPPPLFPKQAFRELLELGFRRNIIDSRDNVVLRSFLGEV